MYRKLRRGIEAAVDEGLLASGAHLPSERKLSSDLGVSRVTVRKSIDQLAGSGLLSRRHGAKTTVAGRFEKQISRLTGFSQEIRSRGMEPGVKWLFRDVVSPAPAEVMALGILPGDLVVRLRRLRFAGTQPIAIESAVVPQAFLPKATLVEDSLYDALERLGVSPVRGVQRIRAGTMNPTEATELASTPGAPMLIVERRCFLADGRAVEYTETRYNGEVYDFVTELTK